MIRYWTRVGLAALRRKLARLEEKLEQSLQNAGEAAQNSSNSYHDNFEYEEGMRQQEMLSSQIREIWATLRSVRPADDPASDDRVALGHCVSLRCGDAPAEELIVCGEGEASLFENVCSLSSPLGHALLGMSRGQKRVFISGAREISVTVLDFRIAVVEDYEFAGT
jgi:transcription elongation GreA/GreB family factor